MNENEINRIASFLKNFDCNEKETRIYIQCLTMGLASVQEVAEKMGENRFTIHSAIEQLVKKGLLYETRKGKRRLIGAEEPAVFHRLLEKKENDIEALKVNLDYTAKLLRSIQPVFKHQPVVRLYEGVEGFKTMLSETLNAKGEVLVFSYVELLEKLLGVEYLEAYFKKRASKNIHTRLIFPPCDFAEKMQKKSKEYKIQIRTLSDHYVWQSGTFLWNNNLAILSYTQQHLTCTIIENRDIADYFRKVNFELCWQQAS